MSLFYIYGVHHTCIDEVKWTTPDGSSFVFQDIILHLVESHSESFSRFIETARTIDSKVDKLYQLIYAYNDENYALPYNPKDRKRFIQVYSEICKVMAENLHVDRGPEERVVIQLFLLILDKLEEITKLYLLDTAYQGKFIARRKDKEVWAETISERHMTFEFEELLLEWNDLINALKELTPKERTRLEKYIFFKYTYQAIAEQEGVRKQSVEESVSKALQKIRDLLSDN